MIPAITREGMIKVDRVMVKDLFIPVQLMMEHAGLNLARMALQFAQQLNTSNFLIVSGTGNNGGGGMVCARRLKAWGFKVWLYLPKGQPTRKVPKLQYTRATKIGVTTGDEFPSSDILVIDALIGYNFIGNIQAPLEDAIELLRSNKVISLDIPTGINSNSGEDVAEIYPLSTLTLAWPKIGMTNVPSKSLGSVYLADIGVPITIFNDPTLYSKDGPPNEIQLSLVSNRFAKDPIVPIQFQNSGWIIKK